MPERPRRPLTRPLCCASVARDPVHETDRDAGSDFVAALRSDTGQRSPLLIDGIGDQRSRFDVSYSCIRMTETPLQN